MTNDDHDVGITDYTINKMTIKITIRYMTTWYIYIAYITNTIHNI